MLVVYYGVIKNMPTFTLKPNAPHNPRFHLEAYSFTEPLPYLYKKGIWQRALRLSSKELLPVEVRINSQTDNPILTVNVFKEITKQQKKEITAKIKKIFNLDYDLKPAYKIMDSDPVLQKIKNDKYGLIPTSFPTVYEAAINGIIQQQISLRAAFYMIAKLIRKYGESVKVNEKEYWEFPDHDRLVKAKVGDLRKLGMSQRKAEYIIDFSKLIARGKFNPEDLRNFPAEEIIETLTQLRGFGRWTAEMIIVTAINFDHINPSGDLGARKAVSRYYNSGKLMSEDEVRKFTQRWGKYQGIITYYLVAALLH